MKSFLLTGVLGVGLLPGSPASAAGTPAGAELSPANLRAAAEYSQQHRGDALLVLQRGQTVFAEGEHGFDLKSRHPLASGSKSFSCALAVSLLDRGQLSSLDERVSDTLTEWHSDPRKATITVRQLLSLTSGLPGGVSAVPVQTEDDVFARGLNAPAQAAPGTRFSYGGVPLAAFGLLVQRKTGMDLAAYLQGAVLNRIGVQATWVRDRKGQPDLARSARLSAHDWALYGQLIAQGGQWQGQTVLSRAGLSQCFQGSAVLAAYGLTWWLNVPYAAAPRSGDGVPVRLGQSNDPSGKAQLAPSAPSTMVVAAGALNQRLYVLPEQDLVVVRFGRGGPWSDEEFLKRLLGR